MKKIDIPYYLDFLSTSLREELLKHASPIKGVEGLSSVGEIGGLENTESLRFLSELYLSVKDELNLVLNRRMRDRKFIDERTKASVVFNRDLKRNFTDPDYQTVMGLEDGEGRIVIGPKTTAYAESNGKKIAPIPEYLQGNHVTLFGPPDNAKLSINAMNAYHRRLKEEPEIVRELLATHQSVPKWGADDEDSKTPLREDLISAGVNLTGCFEGNLTFEDAKKYQLEKEKLSQPIKRFPGLALPSFFLFLDGNPLPLHMYDFALHLFQNWHNPKALCFYVPKLENEEEARYIRLMLEQSERMIQRLHPEYKMGTIRLMIVLENPRAVFRTNEIMDELYPYFAGASLGWHDYLASAARLFKEDANYRIPVKADPDIVIKYIKASHDLLAQVVGARGGIKVGGMYGILPMTNELMSDSFQVTIKGYIRDVVTQLKRDLTGFWVAHPDFVRLGLALVEAWKFHQAGNSSKLESMVKSLLKPEYQQEILGFIHGPDIQGLDKKDPLYPRSLIVADLKVSEKTLNHHPDEIRYNIFQSLQYITDWLSGNGCVALPALVGGVAVRVMDDLATAERSRWEVWHEIYHGRVSVQDFLRIAHEELTFIRKDLSDHKKIVQVKWDERTAKWYPVAMQLMIKLMTDKEPVEFATQLFLPFTIDQVRVSADPWQKVRELDQHKFALDPWVERFNYYFEMCGSSRFANVMADKLVLDAKAATEIITSFSKEEVIAAASFHGDIGESKQTLDKLATAEQARVFEDSEKLKIELKTLGQEYKSKFGFKFLVSAAGKSGTEMLAILKERINRPEQVELQTARAALAEIACKRMQAHPLNELKTNLDSAFARHGINGAQLTILTPTGEQHCAFGAASTHTWFEMASLSKSVASAFAIEYFRQKKIPLTTSVNQLLSKPKSKYRIPEGDKVSVAHLMSHCALNMHYVNGVPANKEMPSISEFLNGNDLYGYEAIKVANPPGKVFQYSGGGFLVLEHLMEALEKKSVFKQTRAFLDQLGMKEFSFEQHNLPGVEYAHGYNDQGQEIEGTRKMFPAFAAGAMSTTSAMAKFLRHLEMAYHETQGSSPISHDTARQMLHGSDKGCKRFMGSKMGLGIFIVEAGLNKFAVHQGANDGFRVLYLHCYDGPNRGYGLVTVANADIKGMLFNAEAAQEILKVLNLEGIDNTKFSQGFSVSNIPHQEVVNQGYKSLIFDAFHPTIPEAIVEKGPHDPLATFNLVIGAKILDVSNELFARGENLFSDHLPKFDPELFGKQGKVMDSWETVRHNQAGVDQMTFQLKKASAVKYILLSTKYHFGNHAPVVMLEGLADKEWVSILPKTAIDGHSEMRIKLENESAVFSQIRVSMYPDGGFTRLGLYFDLPVDEAESFKSLHQARSIAYPEKIPHTVKPLSIKYQPTAQEMAQNWNKIRIGEEFNNSSLALGAKLVKASNEHYGPAIQMISPYGPINMFDGLESARSRKPGHSEEVIVALAKPAPIKRIEMDFTYFVNNNPWEVSIEAQSHGQWKEIVAKENVKAFAGSQKVFAIDSAEVFDQVRVVTWPDGGMNRLKILSVK